MLIHHIFPGMEGFGLKIGQTWILPEIAAWGKVCVSIFLFLSGYGLQERYANKKLSVLEFYRKRFLSLYIPYWMVFVIFISIGFLFFPVYLNNFLAAPFSPKKNLLINFLGLQYFVNGYMGINPSWWFFSQIALIYLLYPLLCAISKIKKFGSLLLGALCFLFSFYLQDVSIKGFLCKLYMVHALHHRNADKSAQGVRQVRRGVRGKKAPDEQCLPSGIPWAVCFADLSRDRIKTWLVA